MNISTTVLAGLIILDERDTQSAMDFPFILHAFTGVELILFEKIKVKGLLISNLKYLYNDKNTVNYEKR
jgi:hypothetical protein